MFSCRVLGGTGMILIFYRNPQAQQQDMRWLRSAGGKQQNLGEFYSLTSISWEFTYSMDYDPFSLRTFLKQGESSKKDGKMGKIFNHLLINRCRFLKKSKLLFPVSPFQRKLLNQSRFFFFLALICLPPWQEGESRLRGTNPHFIPLLDFTGSSQSRGGRDGPSPGGGLQKSR